MENIEKKFQVPPGKYRPVPWWCWTGMLEEKEMERQLKDMLEKGIYEFFIFPIYGIEIKYCSEEWWKKVEFILKKSKEMGMKVWIYDDYNWPSGTCAGFVLRDEPWTRRVELNYKEKEVKKEEVVKISFPGELISVQAVDNKTGEVKEIKDYTLTDNFIFKYNTLLWHNKTGKDYTLVIFYLRMTEEIYPFAYGAPWTWNQRGYIDTLNGKAVRKFLEYTHEQYYKKFKKYFPDIIVGFFTDEPTPGTFPYTKELFKKFKDKYGYDLKERLVELVLDVGNYLKTRYDYWNLVAELLSTNYTKLIYDWCEKHKIKSTGHLLYEETLKENVFLYGDIYEVMKWMQVPGIDILQNATGYEQKVGGAESIVYGNIGNELKCFNIPPKLVSSIARHTGRKRVLCESFGVYSWALTLQEMKKGTDWLTALGINLINDNLLPYCIEGFRKRAISGKSFTSPFWKYYKHFSDYCGRLCMICANGTLKANISILYPKTSACCLLNSEVLKSFNLDDLKEKSENWYKMQETLYIITDALLRTHWSWEFTFEQVLLESKVENGVLISSNASYSVIILPAVSVLTYKEFKKLKEFVQSGGLLIALEILPSMSPDKNWDIQKEVSEIFKKDNAILIKGIINNNELEKQLDNLLSNKLIKPVDIQGEDVRKIIIAHRIHQNEDIQTIFLSNQTKKPVETKIKVNIEGNLEMWDPTNGKKFFIGKNKQLNYYFRGYESIFLVIKKKSSQKLPNIKDELFQYQVIEKEIPLSDEWDFKTETPNMLLLNCYVKLDPKDIGLEEKWYKSTILQEEDGWIMSENNRIGWKLIPDEISFYWIKSNVKFNFIPENLEIVVDNQEFKDLWINGEKVSNFESTELWDKANIKFKINKYVKKGINTFIFRVKPSKYYSNQIRGYIINPTFLEPIVLLGDFAIKKQNELYEVNQFKGKIKAGSWHLQGFPHYAGTGIYQQKFQLSEFKGRFWLDLGDLQDAVEIWVNNKLSGICLWSPYCLEITNFLHKGENILTLKIANTFGNLLKPFCFESILKKPVPSGLLYQPKIVQTK